jgi:hypothetical protein
MHYRTPMNLWRMLVLFGAVAATVSMVDAAVANADEYINFGTNQAACQSAAQQANAASAGYPGYHPHSYCYETGPGSYSLFLAVR